MQRINCEKYVKWLFSAFATYAVKIFEIAKLLFQLLAHTFDLWLLRIFQVALN